MIVIGYVGLLQFKENSNIHPNNKVSEETYVILIVMKSKTDKFRDENHLQ